VRLRQVRGCVGELDLSVLSLEGLPSICARKMQELAAAYLPELERSSLTNLDLFIYVDRTRGLGFWLWIRLLGVVISG